MVPLSPHCHFRPVLSPMNPTLKPVHSLSTPQTCSGPASGPLHRLLLLPHITSHLPPTSLPGNLPSQHTHKSPSSVLPQSFEQTPIRAPDCCYNPLLTSFSCTRQHTHRRHVTVSMILYKRTVLLEDVIALSIHTFL